MTVLIYPSPRIPGISSGILRGSFECTSWYTMSCHVVGYRQAVLRRNLHAGNLVAISCSLGACLDDLAHLLREHSGSVRRARVGCLLAWGPAGFLQLHVTWSLFSPPALWLVLS
jgi:hypothetical protein